MTNFKSNPKSRCQVLSKKYYYIFVLIALAILPLGGCKRVFLTDLPNKLIPRAVSEENSGVQAEKLQYAAVNSDQYDNFYKQTVIVPDVGKIKGGIVPHHLVAGYIPATFFNYLSKQEPSVVVLIGPNHFSKGKSSIIASARNWQTPFGTVASEKNIIQVLADKQLLAIEEDAVVGEHSLSNIIPFVARSLPNTKVVPIMFYSKTKTEKLDALLAELLPLLPKDAVVISSIDFSHYQTATVGNFHDELSRGVIKNFDYARLDKLEIDSTPSLYVLLKSMEYFGDKKIGFELADSAANIARAPSLPSGTSYYSPYFVEGGNQPEKIASILNFGDMMLDRNVRSVIDKNNKDYLFTKLAGEENRFFIGMDAVAANLEGPFANKRRATTKSIAFRFNPDLLPMLKKYNFSLFSLANNHSEDMAYAGFEESKKNLRAAGIDFYGMQYRVDDNALLIKKIGDFTFGFIGINDTNSRVKAEGVIELIKKAEKKGADFVIVNAHWGDEYKELSNTRQRILAKELIDAGADVIIGHHPHVTQEMEIYKNRPIFYSLGNFVFDQYFSVPTQQGLGVGLVFKEKEISAYVFPLQGVKSQVSQMSYEKGIKYMEDWTAKSRLGDYKFSDNKMVVSL